MLGGDSRPGDVPGSSPKPAGRTKGSIESISRSMPRRGAVRSLAALGGKPSEGLSSSVGHSSSGRGYDSLCEAWVLPDILVLGQREGMGMIYGRQPIWRQSFYTALMLPSWASLDGFELKR